MVPGMDEPMISLNLADRTIEEVSWLAEDRSLPVPPLLRLDVTTTFPEVDKPLAEARSRLRGLPVKSQVTVTVDMGKGSTLQTFLLTSTLHDLKEVPTNDSLFTVPSGFRYEKPPEIVCPRANSRQVAIAAPSGSPTGKPLCLALNTPL